MFLVRLTLWHLERETGRQTEGERGRQGREGAADRRAVCAGCHRLIRDRFLLRVTDGLWHEECVRCAACGDALRNSCFLRDRKLYCKRDYHIPLRLLFAVRCGGCSEAVSPAELVMRAGAAVFHLRCFTCSVCSCRLQTGQRMTLQGNVLFSATKLSSIHDFSLHIIC
uniref:LIM homeobox transcription factor 1, alpha n=1 Tax=Amphiprion percula TaxID=161767 RepID=A0A3P8U673_AMPPE